ncbi:1173_t:CDS:2, partial [Diversispora eburnea]
FVSLDPIIKTQIEKFEKEQVILLTGKFVANNGWYTVSATSIQVLL